MDFIMKKRSFKANLTNKFKFLIIFIYMIFLKNSLALQTTPTFVVLPFITESNLVELRNNFTENLIQNLKKGGFNAIGTRYLTSILKMETCSTDDCMRKIASIVGAQYVIYGTMNGDTVTFSVDLHIKDIANNKELISFNQMLVGGLLAASQLSNDLVSMISGANSGTVATSISSTVAPDSGSEKSENQHISEDDTLTCEDTNLTTQEKTEAFIVDSLIKVQDSQQEFIKNDTANNHTDSVQISQPSAPAVNIRQDNKPVVQDSVSNESKNSPDTEKVFIPSYEKKSLIKPLPSRLNQQFFRGTRLLVFGNIAIVGILGGLVMNGKVKQSIEKETELYSEHKKADALHNEATYYSYKKQTEKTDRYSKIRNSFYSVSGVCAIGFSVSVFF